MKLLVDAVMVVLGIGLLISSVENAVRTGSLFSFFLGLGMIWLIYMAVCEGEVTVN